MFRTTATACCSTLRRRGPRDRSWLRPRRLISPRQWWMRTTCSPALLHPRSPPEQLEPPVRRPRRLARPSPQAAQRPLPSRLLQLRPHLSSSSSSHLERLKTILSGMVFFSCVPGGTKPPIRALMTRTSEFTEWILRVRWMGQWRYGGCGKLCGLPGHGLTGIQTRRRFTNLQQNWCRLNNVLIQCLTRHGNV